MVVLTSSSNDSSDAQSTLSSSTSSKRRTVASALQDTSHHSSSSSSMQLQQHDDEESKTAFAEPEQTDQAQPETDEEIAQDNARFTLFFAWLQREGAVYPHLTLRRYAKDYRGVHIAAPSSTKHNNSNNSNKVVLKGKTLLRIPHRLLITVELAKQQSTIGAAVAQIASIGSQAVLAVYLLSEQYKGSASFWTHWLKVMPEQFASLPMFFSSAELSELQGCTELLTKVRAQIHSCRDEFALIVAELARQLRQEQHSHSHSHQFNSSIDASIHSNSDINSPSATTDASSSSQQSPNQPTQVKPTLVRQSSLTECNSDDLNLVLAHYPFMQYESFVWACLAVGTRVFSLSIRGTKTSVLAPFADMFNHSTPSGTHWQWEPKKDCFTLTALCDFAAGDAVYESYGIKCNRRFFASYGFALLDNPANEVSVVVSSSIPQQQQQRRRQTASQRSRSALSSLNHDDANQSDDIDDERQPTDEDDEQQQHEFEHKQFTVRAQYDTSIEDLLHYCRILHCTQSSHSTRSDAPSPRTAAQFAQRAITPSTLVRQRAEEDDALLRQYLQHRQQQLNDPLDSQQQMLDDEDDEAMTMAALFHLEIEIQVLHTVYSTCEQHLMAYPTTLEQDESLLARHDAYSKLTASAKRRASSVANDVLSDNVRNCVVFRLGEKRVFHWLMKLCRDALFVLQAHSYDEAMMRLQDALVERRATPPSLNETAAAPVSDNSATYLSNVICVLVENHWYAFSRTPTPSITAMRARSSLSMRAATAAAAAAAAAVASPDSQQRTRASSSVMRAAGQNAAEVEESVQHDSEDEDDEPLSDHVAAAVARHRNSSPPQPMYHQQQQQRNAATVAATTVPMPIVLPRLVAMPLNQRRDTATTPPSPSLHANQSQPHQQQQRSHSNSQTVSQTQLRSQPASHSPSQSQQFSVSNAAVASSSSPAAQQQLTYPLLLPLRLPHTPLSESPPSSSQPQYAHQKSHPQCRITSQSTTNSQLQQQQQQQSSLAQVAATFHAHQTRMANSIAAENAAQQQQSVPLSELLQRRAVVAASASSAAAAASSFPPQSSHRAHAATTSLLPAMLRNPMHQMLQHQPDSPPA